jgi:starch synthase
MSENYQEIILILGSGNTKIENELNSLLPDYKGNYNTFIGYNEELAHLIYAAADFY